MSSHKPRKRRRQDEGIGSGHSQASITNADGSQTPAFPLAAFLWPARGGVSQWIVLPLILMAVGLFRWSTAMWPYSGFQAPPMHGDFEAQRHWMEITTHLPVSQWYFYDLEWWGLDYPPLTAYHSWLLGTIGNSLNPTWFALDKSRGLDDPDLKLYMRATALVSEYIVYVAAAVILLRRLARTQGVNIWDCSIALTALLLQPSTMLIDHGHFQYNTVMLGFVLATISRLVGGSPLWASFYFVSALGFKQMALFYAPAIFAYLLGSCVTPKLDVGRLLSIALATVASFVMLYGPFLLGVTWEQYRGLSTADYPQPPQLQALQSLLPFPIPKHSILYPALLQVAQSVHRIFPFSRGLFEDKVANLWCSLHTFHKLSRYSSATVQRLALAATLLTCLPPSAILLLRPRKELVALGFAACAWAFFLCSFQVHEKNVLLPLLPMTVLLAEQGGLRPEVRSWVGFANLLAAWTLFPLLKRDGLQVPYFVLTALWAWLMALPPFSLSAYFGQARDKERAKTPVDVLTAVLHLSAYVAMVVWHLLDAFVPPPFDKPDLWVVANVLVGTGGFGLCYCWCLWQLVLRSGWLGVEMKSKTQ